MKQTRVEVYDDNGLVNVYYIDQEEENLEEIIEQKEQQLIEIYEEIKRLKESQNS